MTLDRTESRVSDTGFSRRGFLATAAAAGGGLMLSLGCPSAEATQLPADSRRTPLFALSETDRSS
jgi:hypothetical protein